MRRDHLCTVADSIYPRLDISNDVPVSKKTSQMIEVLFDESPLCASIAKHLLEIVLKEAQAKSLPESVFLVNRLITICDKRIKDCAYTKFKARS